MTRHPLDIDELRQRSIPDRIPARLWDKLPEAVRFKTRWLDRYEEVIRSLPMKYIEAAVKIQVDRKREKMKRVARLDIPR